MMRIATDRLAVKTASITNAGLVLILLVTAMMVAWPRVTNALGMRHAPEPAYRAGQTIDTPADWYSSSSYTLVVFARASCGACQTAQPFLKQLVADLGSRSAVVLGTTGKEPKEEVGYGESLGLAGEAVKIVPAGVRVRATPTLVLVNAQGQVLAAWEGVGPESKQAQIRQTVASLVIGDR
jgi:peroxiredoxin